MLTYICSPSLGLTLKTGLNLIAVLSFSASAVCVNIRESFQLGALVVLVACLLSCIGGSAVVGGITRLGEKKWKCDNVHQSAAEDESVYYDLGMNW
jgi:uncharacterized membrane protein